MQSNYTLEQRVGRLGGPLRDSICRYETVNDLPTGRGLVATEDLDKGSVVGSFADATDVDKMDIYSVQIDADRHVRHRLLDQLNHSCDSNVRLDVNRRLVITSRAVRRGEELTFFYPATEWAMLRPFPCQCGSIRCIGLVSGAKYLPAEVLRRYHLTPHILTLAAAALDSG